MSFCTLGVAVAVTAMKGTPGRLSLSVPSCLNCSASNISSGARLQAGVTKACTQRQCMVTPSEGQACKLSNACSGQRISEACLAVGASKQE